MSADDDARKLFRAFHGRAPKPGEVMALAAQPEIMLLGVGTLDILGYTALSDKRAYVHRFDKRRRPALFVSSDGLQLYALAGGYRFTDRGFVG